MATCFVLSCDTIIPLYVTAFLYECKHLVCIDVEKAVLVLILADAHGISHHSFRNHSSPDPVQQMKNRFKYII